jgi:hypothetical protein
MTLKRAGVLVAVLVVVGGLAGWGLVRLPRVLRAPAGQADRLGDIKRRLPAAVTPDGESLPGVVIPPFVRGELGLTGTQHQRVADLERDTAERLSEILTPEQMIKFDELMRRGPDRPKFNE